MQPRARPQAVLSPTYLHEPQKQKPKKQPGERPATSCPGTTFLAQVGMMVVHGDARPLRRAAVLDAIAAT
jgi:ABC-type uncharacterized transport system YnjBCD substrate-binding protein